METGNLKSKLIILLFVISLGLLIINASIDYLKSDNEKIEKVTEVSIDQLNELFSQVLYDNGIENSWVKTRSAGTTFDSLKFIHYVEIPADRSILPLIKDINSRVDHNLVSLNSNEFEINGKTEINLISDGITKLRAVISHNKKLKIVRPKLAFILLNLFELEEEHFSEIVKEPYPFALNIVPSIEGRNRTSIIKTHGKEFTIEISDKISDSNYLIETDETKAEISECIGRIKSDFSGAKIFLIDESSTVYRSAVYNFIRDEFVKRKISLKRLSDFPTIEAKEDKNLLSIFEFHINQLSNEDEAIYKIYASDFFALQPEIKKLVKRGFKLVYPSSIVN